MEFHKCTLDSQGVISKGQFQKHVFLCWLHTKTREGWEGIHVSATFHGPKLDDFSAQCFKIIPDRVGFFLKCLRFSSSFQGEGGRA